MNKGYFVQILQERADLDREKSMMVGSILEKHFLWGRKHREAIIGEIEDQLLVSHVRACQISEMAFSILKEAFYHKLRHPFGGNPF